MDIDGWRRKIDDIDSQLLTLLNERAKCVMEIGRIKQTTAKEIRDPSREAAIIKRLTDLSGGPYTPDEIASIFSSIIAASRVLQHRLEGQ